MFGNNHQCSKIDHNVALLGGAIGLGGIQSQQPPGVRMMAPGSGKPG